MGKSVNSSNSFLFFIFLFRPLKIVANMIPKNNPIKGAITIMSVLLGLIG